MTRPPEQRIAEAEMLQGNALLTEILDKMIQDEIEKLLRGAPNDVRDPDLWLRHQVDTVNALRRIPAALAMALAVARSDLNAAERKERGAGAA